ncbi:tripartite tricarboxylate transporter substrate binding protein [Pigmentiphaga sp. D-2]|uniref:Bug family tripartite tricarboxylate transporter substrate binding protein n=1 Tax=Pigmentiphaga sp. D-2 TaxID=1002116 RepID=UPI001FB5C534|nr:tripartite tricarboxylate transporter substrate binding protein [Pigmentiphaga sp. D-2]
MSTTLTRNPPHGIPSSRKRATTRRAAGSLALSIALFAGLLACAGARAETFPSKPITLVIQYPVGGPSDILARLIAAPLQARLGQPVIVDARAGAGGTIGTDHVARAKPDGHSLLLSASGPLAISPWLFKKLPYDPLRDLVPVVQVASVPMVLLVNAANPARDAKAFLESLKSNPGKYSYGSSGNGTPQHLAGALLESLAGVKALHVPYRGQAPMATDLMAGQVDFAIDSMVAALPNLAIGRLRPLAVTGSQRSALLPEVPTLQEAGVPGYEAYAWYGIMAPAATPQPVLQTLNRTIREVLDLPEVRAQIARTGSIPVHDTPQAFGAFIRSEHAKWGDIVKRTGVMLN